VRAPDGSFFSQGGISAASDLDSGDRFQNRRLKAAVRGGR
jgi:hypothetical protein